MADGRRTQIQKALAKLIQIHGRDAVLDALATTPLLPRKGRGAPRYFTDEVYRDIWTTVQMHKAATGTAEYACCLKLKMHFVLGGKMKDVSGRTLYRQYQHAIRFMKTDGHPDQEVPANYGGDQISGLEHRWRKELELQLLAKRPASEWEQGLAQLCGNWA